jgi:hypothetical protein|nr:MAG TPA: hypothetical protein [Crassvirales sp.]
MEKKEIIAELLKNGGKSVKDLKVKNVTVTRCENYVRLGITLDKPVAGMVTKDNGVTYEKGETNVIFVSLYSITSLLKDDDDAAFAANHLVEHPDSMSIILSRATLNIIQETVEAGTEYKNPWSNNAEATVFDHETIITHVTDVTLSDFAIRKLDKLADSLLGI